jgi:hypothetical protein
VRIENVHAAWNEGKVAATTRNSELSDQNTRRVPAARYVSYHSTQSH